MSRVARHGLLVLAGLLAACSAGGGGGGDDGNAIEVSEIALDANLGVQHPIAWMTTLNVDVPSEFEWRLVNGEDAILTLEGESAVDKRTTVDGAAPLWGTALPMFSMRLLPVDLAATPDGGALAFGRFATTDTSTGWGIASFSTAGALRWQREFDHVFYGSDFRAIQLTGGATACSFVHEPAPGGLDTEAPVIAMLGADGVESSRLQIPTIHLPEADHPGANSGATTPGVGTVHIQALLATADGGLLTTGFYRFSRLIECGSDYTPRDPETTACGDDSALGFLARFDSAGALVWAQHVGQPWTDGRLAFGSIAVLADGSIITGGTRENTRTDEIATIKSQAVAAHWSASGDLLWVKAFPFGPAPGTVYKRGIMGIVALAAQPDGAWDAAFQVPDELVPRVVRFDVAGVVQRVQIIAPLVGDTSTTRRASAFDVSGPAMAFQQGNDNGKLYVAKLTPN